ncbi:SoxR reducing system RseC family protein [Denitromonas iodatirespirans]|uniref:SoxR reducing system RseC family protein n=1 Tax=Denitromonas iodatirespirans TaxID=2795389 RepID=A0A944D9V4_DENI1|nr:SoxR reducing system RseC family protein [Denitromonas iodatirespirans]MBT0960542.1 SoxR reducing system RseC family protein [Denitromonas iodatirespirans]
MSADTIEHRGVVVRIDGGDALVSVETGGCRSCGHGSHCGIARSAAGRPATILRLATVDGVRTGEPVMVRLTARALVLNAVLGYLLPALALLIGAGIGHASGGNLGAALGAATGFAVAVRLGRTLSARIPGLTPTPTLSRLTPTS